MIFASLTLNVLPFFYSYYVKHLPRVLSDHAPLLLTISPRNFQKMKIFRFDNFWLDYLGCHSTLREAWNFKPHSNLMHAFTHLIACAISKLISWHIGGLNSLDTNISRLELEFLDAENLDALNNIRDI